MTTPPDLRYPVGKFVRPKVALTALERSSMINDIAAAPAAMRVATRGLKATQLDTPYRPDGWTVRQVVHHVPDSHMNAYTRFKLALTEDVPTIKPYDEAKWAELPDSKTDLVEESLVLLEVLHKRWLVVLTSMQQSDFLRKLNHPEWDAPLTLDAMLALYAWHGKHHVAHITALRQRQGW
jgi:uncharacterized damage-inducible protein DinB